ncbi:MAG TPA: preprotein translocase subunit SecY [Candidatus Polarisedimenticolia bacterium]|nr:preprotein translocase subunit SecY [Candidatus Polarisedimenticolia bacterium]
MIETIKNIFNVPDLRKRVLFTFGLLAVYRIGAWIPSPGINPSVLEEFFNQQGGSLLGMVNLFSGGNLERLTIFALGIMPYISSSIILQLLTVIWPYLEKLSKEGEVGRKKITTYTRWGTIALSIVQGAGIAVWAQNAVPQAVPHPGPWFIFMTVVSLTTGTAFIMWLGEQITERGIGNGISLIIFAGIVVGLVPAVLGTGQDVVNNRLGLIPVMILLALMVVVVGIVVFVERAQRRIPVQYARRMVGRRQYGGTSTHMPLKVNTGGVIPVIFASSILSIPQMLASFGGLEQVGWIRAVLRQLEFNTPVHNLLYLVTIIFFCYFYTSIIFNPVDVADNLKKYGGFIPGIRPGKRTAEHIDRILSRITLGGALYLGVVALLPTFLISGVSVQTIPWLGPPMQRALPEWITQGLGINFFFGGTSLLIVVGVAMDTVQQVESQLIMRHYDGFLKGSRIRGRRG